MGPYRIILADDHRMVRQGLKRILQERNDLEVVGEAECGLELLNLLKQSSPHMTILDISMPNLRGIEAIHEIRMIHPDMKILVLTMHKDKDYLHQALSAGANGYLLKEDADRDLFSAIEKIRQGRTYVSPGLADDLANDWAQIRGGDYKPSEFERLTNRERQVLKLIAEGKSSKEIGDLLCISGRTVERHRANIMEKLNLKKTADLIKYAIEKEYV